MLNTQVLTLRRCLLVVSALASFLFAPHSAAQVLEERNYIRVDQFGYLPGKPKFAVIAMAVDGFNSGVGIELDESKDVELRRVSDDSLAFSKSAVAWSGGGTDSYSGDRGWWYDFSEYEEEGEYYLRVAKSGGGVVDSYPFLIDKDVYREVLRVATNMFYYQRAGIAKTAEYASGEDWVDEAWFLHAGQELEARYLYDSSIRRDVSGGWIDAGDPNKYITFAVDPVHNLLTTFRQHRKLWEGLDLKIPESDNDIPDLLDEIKWEIDWVMKMQDFSGSGGFHIKSGVRNDSAYISPPSADTRFRYFEEICPSATIIGAGMIAHAAVVFRDYPDLVEYAANLEARAEVAWDFYIDTPDNQKNKQCDERAIEAGDADGHAAHYSVEHVAEAVCAAVYLFELSGKSKYRDFVDAHYLQARPWMGRESEWGVYRANQSESVLHYAHLPDATPAVSQAILNHKTSSDKSEGSAYEIVESANLYRAEATFANWGSNSLLARQASDVLDFNNYGLKPELAEKYEERGLGIINYFHGVNPFGITYLTNMYRYGAEFSVNEMWHTWFNMDSKYDNIDKPGNVGPAPGYMSGGFNKQYTGGATMKIGVDEFPSVTAKSQPTQKAYTNDNWWEQDPWVFNEPGLYYSASYIKALANFVDAGPETVGEHFDLWLESHYGSGTNRETVDIDSDTDGDGLTLLEEFMYDFEPEVADAFPDIEVVMAGDKVRVILPQFNESIAEEVYWFASENLKDWDALGPEGIEVQSLSDASQQVEVAVEGAVRFLRSSLSLVERDTN